jgi:quercetin dioxygenase-like cupin family protein
MRAIRRFDEFPTEPGTHQPEFMAHLESCSVVKGGIPPGTAADPLHKHPFDQFYFVLSGAVGVQLGSQIVRAEPNTLVRIPAGVAHFAYNDGVDEVVQLEILLPTPVPATKGKLVPIMELCDQLGDAPPPNCVRPVEEANWISPAGPGLESQVLASRESGSEHGMIAVRANCIRVGRISDPSVRRIVFHT